MSTATDTRIEAACSCGKRYLVRSELAGKTGKCKCGSTFVVPESNPGVCCPTCNSVIAPGQHFCEFCHGALADESGQPAWNDPSQYEQERNASQRKATPVAVPSASPTSIASSSDTDTPPHWDEASADLPTPDPPWWKNPVLLGLTITFVIATLFAAGIQRSLRGPDFLTLYFWFGVFCLGGVIVARFTSCSTLAGLVVVVLAYELVGLARYQYGISHGMHRFGIMTTMMWMGPLGAAFVAFMTFSGDGGSSFFSSGCGSSCSGSSCGSSCGGGCGGGGCGGCGG